MTDAGKKSVDALAARVPSRSGRKLPPVHLWDPPYQGPIDIMGQPGRETQGLWRIVNDFMGGPFRNYAWYDEATSTYYMIDVFVHAPKEGKKKFMRHLDYVLSTLRPLD